MTRADGMSAVFIAVECTASTSRLDGVSGVALAVTLSAGSPGEEPCAASLFPGGGTSCASGVCAAGGSHGRLWMGEQ
jgi:hypothetical protein